jgi:F-type H+-transporting ATPase subunit a
MIKKILLLIAAALPLMAAPASAQGTPKPTADYIMPHLQDSKHLELPCIRNVREWNCEVTIPTVYLPGTHFDLMPTKHGVFLILTMFIVCLVSVILAQRHARQSDEMGRPRGAPVGFEGVSLYMRQVFMKALGGHGGEKFIPFVMSLFFFITVANVFGLVPWGASATGNMAVTLTLAIITLLVVEITGMKELGAGYISTIVYWPHDMPLFGKILLTILMTPIELLGKITKPFALTVRLFANMVTGHVIILAFLGMIFTSLALGIPALGFAFHMMFMELFLAVLHPFIFAMLSSLFIGQIRTAHH